jgi:transposase
MFPTLHSKTSRSMMTFFCYQFKQLLKSKAEEHNSVVFDVNEAFTSKTCLCKNGVINWALTYFSVRAVHVFGKK